MLVRRLHRTLVKDILPPVRREARYYGVKPRVGTLFLTYRCTSKCRTCTAWKRNATAEGEIGLEDWVRISDQLYQCGIRAVEFFGGDVFLRKDVVIPLIRHWKERPCVIHIPTNTNLIDEEVAKALAKEKVDFLYFSVDGVSEVQDRVRGIEGSFDKVTKAVALVRKFRGFNTTPQLICNTTISNMNVGTLSEIAQYAFETGFDQNHYEYVGEMTEEHIAKSEIDGVMPTPFYVRQGESVLLNRDQAIGLKQELEEIRRRYANTALSITTVNVDTLSVENLYEGTISNKRCYVLRTEVTIDPYGNVVACPVINNVFFGNAVEQDLETIWNNDAHKTVRKHQRSGDIYLCRHCILGVQRNHSLLTAWKRNLFMT